MDRIERIRERAYLLWERGDRTKDDAHYWLQAEREIDTDRGLPKKRAPARKPGTKKAVKAVAKAAKATAKDVKSKAKAKPTPKPKPNSKPKESFRSHR